MAADGVAGSALDPVQGALELRIGECLDLPALVADDVVMVLPACVQGLEPGRAGADVDPLHEAVPAQLLERPVDAGDPHGASLAAEPIEDLLRGQAAVLAAEQLDHGAPGAAVPVSPGAEGCERPLRPRARSGRRHALTIAALDNSG
jgi:hypothetical protein